VFTRSLEVERRGFLEGERAGGDGIRTLDLYHAADKSADFRVIGPHLELSAGEYGVVGQRKITVFPLEYGQLRDLRLNRVRLKPNLSHGSEVGAIGYGEILLQFGAVDFAVDGLLLKRIGVIGRSVPRGDDRHIVVRPGSVGVIFIADSVEAERIREVQVFKGRSEFFVGNVAGAGMHIFAGNDVHINGAFRLGVPLRVVGREDDLEPQLPCLQKRARRQ